LWLAGIGLGVTVAGVGAYLIIRRRLEHVAEEDALLEVRAPSPSTSLYSPSTPTRDTAASTSPAASTPTAPSVDSQQFPGEEPVAEDEDDEDDPPAYIGNIHTLIYHDATSDNLPAVENQVYFSDEQEALAAGFHRDRSEGASTERHALSGAAPIEPLGVSDPLETFDDEDEDVDEDEDEGDEEAPEA
ncbi:MAG TPA: hypothetical protein VKQ36_00430, partial [Ktedonobacterales bacterium]|nr:hypothetical protein [Ktedonobacterales bacterium]